MHADYLLNYTIKCNKLLYNIHIRKNKNGRQYYIYYEVGI